MSAPGRWLRANVPYILIAIAAVGLVAVFFRSEAFRYQSDATFSRGYEIQWRSSQVKEYVIRVENGFQLAMASGKMPKRVPADMAMMKANIGGLLSLPYADQYLGAENLDRLRRFEVEDLPAIQAVIASGDYSPALPTIERMFDTAVDIMAYAGEHTATLAQKAQIDVDARQNMFLLMAALCTAAAGYGLIHTTARRRLDEASFLRSLSALYEHVVQSRISGIRLYLAVLQTKNHDDPMLGQAQTAIQELDEIHAKLRTITFGTSSAESIRLPNLLRKLEGSNITIEIRPLAESLKVPSAELHIILDELIKNAQTAIKDQPDGAVRITAEPRLWNFRKYLNITVSDNGPGMSPEILAKATQPFFTTKSGRHNGLGLTACNQLVRAIRGRLRVKSTPGQGTTIVVSLPL